MTDEDLAELIDDDTAIFEEEIGGALIDAARITVMAAMRELQTDAQPSIVLPGQSPEPGVFDCLGQAMNWLDVARAKTVAEGASPITSIHHVSL